MEKKIIVLDTTLRDGEQVPGAKLNLLEKMEIANQLKKLNVDIIEAGFPSSSAGDFEAVMRIAKEIGKDGPMITALARAVKSDIDSVYQSVRYAKRPLIHMVLGTSAVHLDKKFRKTKEEVLKMGVDAVKYAKTLLPEVQYSTEDAARSEFEYLWQTIEQVVKAGATMINIPDTVGYAVPEEFGELIRKINDRLKNLDPKVILSVHCHNDTGLATANTLAAIKNGADKIECTINGIGERAGNAALEEVVMGMMLRKDYYHATTGIITTQIKKTSQMVSGLMGIDIQVNKAITGDNAFAHSSGIHQDGLLKSADVYEVIRPEDIGVEKMELILTARSGKHALNDAIRKLGFEFKSEKASSEFHQLFLELADKKKEIYDHDLFYLLKEYFGEEDENIPSIELYQLIDFQLVSNNVFPSAVVKVKRGNETLIESATGNGSIDAIYNALEKLTGVDVELLEYKTGSVSKGQQALGRSTVQLRFNDRTYLGRALDTDVAKASAVAFLNGINKIILDTHK